MHRRSCFVVGQGAIALKCLEILVQIQEISGIYSTDRSLLAWAEAHGILHSATRDEFEKLLLGSEYEYLFSINNGWVMPEPVLMRARQATINYHNSLLPKYAGVNATAWALIHGETQHGVTWHEATATIDMGRILKQVTFPISPNDTALSVNTRCAEVAVAAFSDLVDELAADRIVATAQNLAERSYFGLSDRPSAAGVLNWSECTETLRNLVRALDFEPTYNPIALPKLWLPGGVIAARTAQAIPISPHPIGQVLSLEANSLQVATADGSLKLSGLTTLVGVPLSGEVLGDRYGVRVGMQLPLLSEDLRQTIDRQNAAICRHERVWSQHLAQLVPFVPPYRYNAIDRYDAIDRHDATAATNREAIALPEAQPELLLAVFAAYCARLATREPEFDLALQTETQRNLTPELFAASVPLRVRLQADETFTEFSDRFVASLRRADRLGSYALDGIARDPNLRGAKLGALPVAIVQSQCPDALKLESLGATLAFVAYTDGSAPELIDTGAIDSTNRSRQLQTFAAACFAHPQQALSTLPLMPIAEVEQILVEWNQTAKPYPQQCIHELVAAQAAHTPNAPAVCFGEMQLSYRDLDRHSNQLAHWLIQQGIVPDARVVLCVPRSVEMLIGMIGILKAGGAYVPIDPTYPIERINALLTDSRPCAVVTMSALRDRLFPRGLFSTAEQVVCLDEHSALALLDTTPPVTDVTPAHLAYIIYTSGSTGKPKGVEIEHRSLVNHSWAIADLYGLKADDRMLQSASMGFDVAGEQIYPTLLRGGTVVIRPDDLLESFDRFTRFLSVQRITTAVLPTAFWHEWVAELATAKQPLPSTLRTLSVGTEKVLANRLDQWQQLTKGRVAFFQGYGPTEATITCTIYRHDDRTRPTVPIGRPLPNTEIYILDAHLQPVPIGVVGELCVGGDGLARGYHGQPELTDRQFIPHPFRAGARLYKTGDFARFETSGEIIYCDRADDQIKLNGFRIELGEIEGVLNAHAAVKQAIVHPCRVAGSCILVAYVVLQRSIAPAELRATLERVLPSYMIPTIVEIETLPLLPNGKVNRRVLPPPQPRATAAPRDAIEQQLIQIWQDILKIDAIGIQDNFFAIGGSSLTAVRLSDRIQAAFGRNLPLATVFQFPSIAQLAPLLRQADAPITATSLVALQTQGDRTPLFLFQGVDLYGSLTAQLPNQPVYGLAFEMNRSFQFQRLEELAAHYIQELQTIQIRGPYLLGGASFGGIVALEVAQQLQAAGETVALLALFDTPAPGAFRQKPWIQRLLGHAANLSKFGLSYATKKLENRLRHVAYLWSQQRSPLAQRLGDDQSRYKFVRETYRQIAATYQLQPYAGRITLFLAAHRSAIEDFVIDPALHEIDPLLGWEKLARSGVEVYEIPGDHLSIFKEPQVHLLAQQLQHSICQATKPGGSPGSEV